jgi:hypothetical protein
MWCCHMVPDWLSKQQTRPLNRSVAGNFAKLPGYACWTSREKLAMHTLKRFAFTPAQLLVGGYMFGACVLVAHAQAQQPLYTPGPPVPTAPGSNAPPPVPTAPGSSVPPPAPTAPESSVPPAANEPPSAARTHERTSVAKTVHHRGRSIVAAQTLPPSWRRNWDPRSPCCPRWDYPYGQDRWQWWWVEARPWWLLEGPP